MKLTNIEIILGLVIMTVAGIAAIAGGMYMEPIDGRPVAKIVFVVFGASLIGFSASVVKNRKW